jgi:acetyl-CoA acyltransferase
LYTLDYFEVEADLSPEERMIQETTREFVDEKMRVVAATEAGRFDEEIFPIEAGDDTVVKDEGLRPGTTAESLAELPTVFKEDGTATPGNTSQISDGAAAIMLMSRRFAEDRGFDIVAEVDGHEVAGVDPEVIGISPVLAVKGLMERTGRTIDEYDLIELNEAFTSQTLYCQCKLGIDDDVFNVNGGAIVIGHPLGASDARLPVTPIHEMHRRDADRGLSTMCMGYGQRTAIGFRAPDRSPLPRTVRNER